MNFIVRICACICAWLFAIAALPSQAIAAEVEGIRLDDSITLANQSLQLSGAGVRQRQGTKVLVLGLYLSGRHQSTQEVLAARGAKRTTLVMLQDLDTDKFVRNFIVGMQENSDKAERMRLTFQFVKFGEICAAAGILRKGDVVTFDLIPASGTLISVNGRKLGEPIPDEGFYNVFLKFFLGDKPTDPQLKQQVLAGVAKPTIQVDKKFYR